LDMPTPSTVPHKRGQDRSHSPSNPPEDQPNEPKVPKFSSAYKEGLSKTKASDYETVVEAMILRSCKDFEAAIVSHSAFPNHEEKARWVKDAWAVAGAIAKEDFKLTARIAKYVSDAYPTHSH
jgi:hypothetical protein